MRHAFQKMLKRLKQKIRGTVGLWRYTLLYRRMAPYYKEHPQELKMFCLKVRWKATQENNKSLHIFADWMEGWLKQEGHW